MWPGVMEKRPVDVDHQKKIIPLLQLPTEDYSKLWVGPNEGVKPQPPHKSIPLGRQVLQI